MPAELRERFTRTQWKDCCGKGCKKCDIAQTYIGEYGKKEGLERLNDDRAAVKAGKAAAKAGKKSGDGKKAGGKKGGKAKKGGKKGGKAKKGKGGGKKGGKAKKGKGGGKKARAAARA